MSKFYVSPASGKPLKKKGNWYISKNNSERFPIINSIPRFCDKLNYSESFGYQWNKFDTTQLDSINNINITEYRFYKSTNWDPELISKENVLEVGSGAGRFTEVFLKTTKGVYIVLITLMPWKQILKITTNLLRDLNYHKLQYTKCLFQIKHLIKYFALEYYNIHHHLRNQLSR